MDLPWDSWLHQKLPFFWTSTGGLASNDRSKAGQAQNRAFRRTSPLGFPENLESSREGSWTLRCFFEAKLWIVLLDFVSWLWIGRFFESSQDCELTHVQSSSKNTFKKKGWVIKLSVCQNFAVRNARGCGSEDEIQPPLWPSVLPCIMAKLCHIHLPCPRCTQCAHGSDPCFKNVREANLASTRCYLEAWDLCICQRSAKAADWDSLTLQMIRLLIIPLSIHLNVQVAWWKIIKKIKRKFFCCAPWRWHGSRI